MSSPPYMPLYIADYLADTQHFSASEHGAYLLLIMAYWKDGSLPADEKRLARIACMTSAEWKRSSEVIREKFGDDWRHARIDKELAKATEKHAKRVAAGSAGGKQKASNASSNALPFSSFSGSIPENNKLNNYSSETRPSEREAFPASGSISYSPFGPIAREHGHGADVDILATHFRKWCKQVDQPLDSPHIGKSFATFCKSHRIGAAA